MDEKVTDMGNSIDRDSYQGIPNNELEGQFSSNSTEIEISKDRSEILKKEICTRWNRMIHGFDQFPKIKPESFNDIIMGDEDNDPTLEALEKTTNISDIKLVRNLCTMLNVSSETFDEYCLWMENEEVKFSDSKISGTANIAEDLSEDETTIHRFTNLWNEIGSPKIDYSETKRVSINILLRWIGEIETNKSMWIIQEMNGAWSVIREKDIQFNLV